MRYGRIILLALILFLFAKPIPAEEPPLLVLMPGGSGIPKPAGYLVRNKLRFEHAGFQVLISSTSNQAAQAARRAKAKAQKVYLVGISIGAARAMAALEAGATADAAVFFSGAYAMGRTFLRSPQRLPPTMMIHHRRDRCPVTTPMSA